MTTVAFSQYDFKLKKEQGKEFIFDLIRKKYVQLTPEEWVRQHILHYLVYDLKYAASVIAVERGLELNGLQKRFDVVVFSNTGAPAMIIECKAPEEKLDTKVFEQIARYNLALKVAYLWVTNGSNNFCCSLKDRIELVNTIPPYEAVRTAFD